jgi:hypothetical protein
MSPQPLPPWQAVPLMLLAGLGGWAALLAIVW